MATKWGICAAGKISNDFMAAMKLLSSDEHQAVAVAEHDLEKARDFATLFNIKKCYGSYEDLANDEEVEIVYIGSINIQHYDQCLMMLNANKHVLCEKPMMLNVKQTKEVLALAKQKQRFFMEGLWNRFYPVYDQIRKELACNSIGEVKYVAGYFCAPHTNLERMTRRDLGGGSLYDLGIYIIQFACMIFQEYPQKIVASGHLNNDGVDTCASVTLTYSNGRMAHCMSSMQTQLEAAATVLGTRGKIEVPHPFWTPYKLITPTKKYEFPIPQVEVEQKYYHAGGFTYQIKCVQECLKNGHLECPRATHADSIMVATILEEARRQIGVSYDVDQSELTKI